MYLNKQKKKDLINLIYGMVEDYKLFLPYVILNEKIDLKGYQGKQKEIFSKIKKLKNYKKFLEQ